MKFWLDIRNLPNCSNFNRTNLIYTLLPPYRPSFLLGRPHYTGRKLWLNYTVYSCKWSIMILHLHLYPHRSWNLLRFLHIHGNMKYWSYFSSSSHSHSICWICSSMRTNKILRSHCHHELVIRNPIRWRLPSELSMRRVCCG